MSVEVVPGTPLAESLQHAVHPKLAEMGWSSGGLDDSALAEYIVLMLVNGKTQDQIASELSTDLLGLDPEDSGAMAFAKWLFEQVQILSRPGGAPISESVAQTASTRNGDGSGLEDAENILSAVQDADMGDATDGSQTGTIPTGPKSMRDGSRPIPNKRILGQMNRAMDRTPDAALHRIKGAAGVGRINSHTREPPKGPTPRGPRSQMARNQGGPQVRQMQNMPAVPSGPAAQMGQTAQNPGFAAMTPQQQMQLFAMYEEQARMMAQILSPQQQQQMSPFPQPQQTGKSLFERVEGNPARTNGNFKGRQYQNGYQTHRAQTSANNGGDQSMMDANSSMEVEPSSQLSSKPDPDSTVCYFNLTCTKADCHFVHQSPAAPPGTTIDMTDTCSFGAACKNRKCVGKHPSPGKVALHKAQADCIYYPNCTNTACPFKHPSMPPCRNGADCPTEGCKFSHSKVPCRFDPCLNPACVFKHRDGQKRGTFADKVWINTEEGGEDRVGQHVSERKFVDDDGEEDLILPGTGDAEQTKGAEGLIT